MDIIKSDGEDAAYHENERKKTLGNTFQPAFFSCYCNGFVVLLYLYIYVFLLTKERVRSRAKRRLKLNEKLLKYLVEHGLLTQSQADKLREEHKESGNTIRELVTEQSLVSEENLLEALAAISKLPTIRLYEEQIPLEVRQLVRADLLRENVVLPFAFDPEDPTTILVALNDPMNMRGRDLVAIASKCKVRPFLATTGDILLTIDRYYGTDEMQEAADMYTRDNEITLSIEEEIIREDINSSPVVMLVNSLVEQAVRQRASDIHVEAEPDRVRVRCRVDGVLYTTANYNLRLLPAIVARIKIISGMDISEKRKPQDGRFSMTVDHREYDIRVSVLPTVYGEKCVLRLNQKKALSMNKKMLGMRDDDLEKFDKILSYPNGIVLVTGPTGSGKSTTLYTALSELNSDMVNIITVEDPVEANIEGINQVQVNVKADMTFANALRSILRQDPDIIMIGEIRDTETASIAVQASITGHLVVSTLHTNDTASSVTRLLDMGVESYLIADSTVGIIAQRLVRRLCPNCRKQRHIRDYEAAYMGLSEAERKDQLISEPVGCQRCNGTGYYGRIGVYEIMEITPNLRGYIARRASTDALREAAIGEGMLTLKQSVRRLVLDGTTSLAEMQRISVEDQSMLMGTTKAVEE